MISSRYLIALLLITLPMTLADPSFIENTGGAQLATQAGNVSIGTQQSLGRLHINGSIYQDVAYVPKIIGSITDVRLDAARSVYIQGKYAYVTAQTNDSLSIIDISNPYSPFMVSHITDALLDGVADVYVSGKYAYVAALNANRFVLIDVSNASKPVITGSLSTLGAGPAYVYISGKYAYGVGNSGDRFAVIDISNPFSPTLSSSITSSMLDGAIAMRVVGKYAYVVSENNDSLTIIDVSNGTSPVIVSHKSDPRLDRAWDIYVSGRYAYIPARDNNSLVIIDVSNVASPVIVGFVEDARLDGAKGVYVSGKYAYVAANDAASFNVIDVSNTTSPRIVKSITDTRLNGTGRVFVSGKYAYINANTNDSLSIIDIGGIDSPSASIGAVKTGSLSVTENAQVANDLYVGNGMVVGPGGAYINGKVSIFADAVNNSNASLLTVGNSTASLVAVFGNGSGKIYVGTIDPVYTIDGKQYATYLPAMTDVKEETTGTFMMKCLGSLCRYSIDFSNLEEGSDLWLFSKVTNLKENFDKMNILLTPSFDGHLWSGKHGSILSIMARKSTDATAMNNEVSYRLTAPRFDHEKWTNYNNDGVKGFVLDDDV